MYSMYFNCGPSSMRALASSIVHNGSTCFSVIIPPWYIWHEQSTTHFTQRERFYPPGEFCGPRSKTANFMLEKPFLSVIIPPWYFGLWILFDNNPMLYHRFKHAKFYCDRIYSYGGEDGRVKNIVSGEKRASLTHFVRSLRSQWITFVFNSIVAQTMHGIKLLNFILVTLLTRSIECNSLSPIEAEFPWVDVDVNRPDAINLLKWIQWESNINGGYILRRKLSAVDRLRKVCV